MELEPEKGKSPLIRRAEAIEAAVNEAVREALLMHKRLGNPIAVWENEQVRWIPPDEIEIPDDSGAD